MSATSRSRPKKTAASSTSNEARPLNGHAGGASESAGCARSRDRLELDDLAGDVVAGEVPAGALGRRARRRLADAPGRQLPRPRGRRAVHARGDAAALGEQPVHRGLDRSARARRGSAPSAATSSRAERRAARSVSARPRPRPPSRRRARGARAATSRRRRASSTTSSVGRVHLSPSSPCATAPPSRRTSVGELLHEPRLADARPAR